jgi:carbonic anhydrase
MTVVPELLAANECYAAQFTYGDLPVPPAKRLVVLTCMDARIDPLRALGLKEGDAHVLRNSGGRPTSDMLRSLAVSQEMLGTREIVVIHHTECGSVRITNELMRERLAENIGRDAAIAANVIDFLPFRDLAQSVRDDLAVLRATPLLRPETEVSGFIFDVKTGRIHAVDSE